MRSRTSTDKLPFLCELREIAGSGKFRLTGEILDEDGVSLITNVVLTTAQCSFTKVSKDRRTKTSYTFEKKVVETWSGSWKERQGKRVTKGICLGFISPAPYSFHAVD